MQITNLTSVEELLICSKYSFLDVKSGEEFIVQYLFRKFEWNRIDLNTRQQLGIGFFNYAQKLGANKIIILNKTSENQQIYKKA